MKRKQNPNLDILEQALNSLGKLADEMVFLGGCATGLLITDPAAPPIRQTKDVDAIVHVISQAEYYQLSEKLRNQGFSEDTSEDAPICRWISGEVILDVMPTDSSILGFSNKWYQKAMENAETMGLPSGRRIRLVSTPYFLVTKLEAFDGRGEGDYQISHDIEDIVAVLDGRPGLIEEINNAEPMLVTEIKKRFRQLRHDSRFLDAIPGHLPPDESSQARVRYVVDVIVSLSASGDSREKGK